MQAQAAANQPPAHPAQAVQAAARATEEVLRQAAVHLQAATEAVLQVPADQATIADLHPAIAEVRLQATTEALHQAVLHLLEEEAAGAAAVAAIAEAEVHQHTEGNFHTQTLKYEKDSNYNLIIACSGGSICSNSIRRTVVQREQLRGDSEIGGNG